MNKRSDPENLLKGLNCPPGAKVKHAVMERYAQAFKNIENRGFWQRGVPLYQAVAAVILAALISAFAVSNLAVDKRQPQPVAVESQETAPLPEIEPFIALSDKF
jgi:hypothetical protein